MHVSNSRNETLSQGYDLKRNLKGLLMFDTVTNSVLLVGLVFPPLFSPHTVMQPQGQITFDQVQTNPFKF